MSRALILFSVTFLLLVTGCSSDSTLGKGDHYGLFPGMRYEGHYKIGKPYRNSIDNRMYHPKHVTEYDKIGVASWYGPRFHKRKTANGDTFDKRALTAAHNTLPMPSMIRVTNMENGRTVILMVNDRGPFAKKREIDVSERAAELLAFKEKGHTKVRVEYLPKETDHLLAELGLERYEGALAKRELANNSPFAKKLPHGLMKQIEAPVQVAQEERHHIHHTLTPPNVKALASNQHYVQIGAFKKLANAEKYSSELRHYGPLRISKVDDLHILQIGPFSQRGMAEKLLKKVVNDGHAKAVVVAAK